MIERPLNGEPQAALSVRKGRLADICPPWMSVGDSPVLTQELPSRFPPRGNVRLTGTHARAALGKAGRYERYSDFGSTWNGKFAARWEPVQGYAVRGSLSNGFRARAGEVGQPELGRHGESAARSDAHG
jgi:hypothetical protein